LVQFILCDEHEVALAGGMLRAQRRLDVLLDLNGKS